jgi:PilZ domain
MLLDVSQDGVCLIATQAIDAETEVEVIICGNGLRQTHKRVATVRWQFKLDTGQFCLGIKFNKRLDYRDWQNVASHT